MTEDPRLKNAPDPEAAAAKAGFVRRWLRRKSEARAATGSDAEASSANHDSTRALDEPEAPAEEALPSESLTDADMPPLDKLEADSDYSAFFSPRVSAELRRLALRKLFHSPAFNVRDPLDSEAGDFRNFQPLGDTITADMRHQLARAEQALKEYAQRDADGDSPDPQDPQSVEERVHDPAADADDELRT